MSTSTAPPETRSLSVMMSLKLASGFRDSSNPLIVVMSLSGNWSCTENPVRCTGPSGFELPFWSVRFGALTSKASSSSA